MFRVYAVLQGNIIMKLFLQFFCRLFMSVWYCLSEMIIFIPNHGTDLMPFNLLVARCSCRCFFLISLFPALCYSCSNFLKATCCHHIKNKLLFSWNGKIVSLSLCIFLCLQMYDVFLWDHQTLFLCFAQHPNSLNLALLYMCMTSVLGKWRMEVQFCIVTNLLIHFYLKIIIIYILTLA